MSFRLTHLYSNNLNHRKRIFHTGGDIIGDLTVRGSVTITKDAFVEGRVYEKNHILLPAGTVVQSAAVVAPEGWVECDGRILLRTDPEYKDLFASIGDAYSGDFSGDDISFNVPDFRGRVPVGVGMGESLSLRVLGASGGAETHTLTTNEIPAHSHTINDPGHSHTMKTEIVDKSLTPNATVANNDEGTEGGIAGNSNTTGITINDTGGGLSHNNMQPFLCVRYIIKL